jgi:hypothetical protein
MRITNKDFGRQHMRRSRMTILLAGVVAGGAVLLGGAAGAGAAPTADAWSRAIEVPGLAALNADGRAEVLSVSCGPAGDCAAGGSYQNSHRHLQGFVVSEQDDIWGSAIGVPGLTALNAGGRAEVLSVSCGPAGGCAAGGYYYDSQDHQQGFVASELNGTWSKAIEVPGLAALSAGFAEVSSVSCGPAGDCAAGGYYYNHLGQQGFVVSEQDGTWGQAIEPPGLAALNAGGPHGLTASAGVTSVSCDPAGDCAAGGYYQDPRDHQQGFVVSEQVGTWGKAIPVPGLALLNTGGIAEVTSVSCGSAGNCAAGGSYKVAHAVLQGFVATELNGRWGKATEPSGLAALNAGGSGRITSVSCVPAGNCTAGGSYVDGHRHGQGFVASEQAGTWGTAIKVPGLVALNAGGSAKLLSLSCSPAGNCAAGGSYLDHKQDQQGFVASEQNGTWGKAIEVPGLAALNAGVAQVGSVSCGLAGNCAAGGYYQDRHRNTQGFVVSQG